MSSFAWQLKVNAGDVQLSPAERSATYRAPLFVCPKAEAVMAGIGVNPIEKKVSAAKDAQLLGRDDDLGRQAIGHVLKCKPTLYMKLLHTCNVINYYFHQRGEEPPIVASDIVVCAFRIREYRDLRDTFGFTDDTLADVAGVLPVFTKTLAANYRLHLAAVLKIYGALRDKAVADPTVGADIPNGLGQLIRKLREDDVRGVIAADNAAYLNVQKVPPFDKKNETHYLLTSDNVQPAPPADHPWAWTVEVPE